MQHRWDALQIKIGDKLIPVLERLMPVIESIIDGIDRFTTNFPTATTVILTAVAAVGCVAVVVAPVLTAIAALIGSIAFLGVASRKASIELAARGGARDIASKGRDKLNAASTLSKAGVVGSLFAMIPAAYELSSAVPLGGVLYDLTHDDPLKSQKPIVHAIRQTEPIAATPTMTTTTNQNTYHITMNANNGQDGAVLVDEMEREIKRRDDARGRGMMANRESDL
jgi:hypothetical protein